MSHHSARAILCLFAMSAALAGCGKDGAKPPPTAASAPTGAARGAGGPSEAKLAPSGPPIHFKDDRGETVSLPGPATRIVSLTPATTEVLFAVGCGERVVLRDSWSDYPPAARKIPRARGLKVSAESIIVGHPDVVLTGYLHTDLARALKAVGIPAAEFKPQTVAEVLHSFEAIAAVCGQREAGAALRKRLEADLQRVADVVGPDALTDAQRPGVYLELDASRPTAPYTTGPTTFAHDIITRAGGRNVFGDGRETWFRVTAEAIVARKPDVVLLSDADVQGRPQTPAAFASRPGMVSLPAVEKGRVHRVTADWVSRPGPRLVLGIDEIARLLHPDKMRPVARPRPTDGADAADAADGDNKPAAPKPEATP